MSETSDTHDAVRAATNDAFGGAPAVSAATDEAMDKASPDDPVLKFMREAEERFLKIEQTLFGIAPQIAAVYDALEKPVETALPQTGPVFLAIDTLRVAINGIIKGLHLQFGQDKLAMPPTIAASDISTPAG